MSINIILLWIPFDPFLKVRRMNAKSNQVIKEAIVPAISSISDHERGRREASVMREEEHGGPRE